MIEKESRADRQLFLGSCRKRFVAELVMSLHDSALSNSHLQNLAISFIYKVPNAPAFASDLVLRAGASTNNDCPLKSAFMCS